MHTLNFWRVSIGCYGDLILTVGNQDNDEEGDAMIETLVMPLPSEVTKAIIDIAVVLGENYSL